MLKNSDAPRTLYIHRMNVIKEILIDAKASHSLKAKVLGYYQYMVSANEGHSDKNCSFHFPHFFFVGGDVCSGNGTVVETGMN